jgi:hypothetical protein
VNELDQQAFRTRDDIYGELAWDDTGPACEFPEDGAVLDPEYCPSGAGEYVTRIEVSEYAAQHTCDPDTIRADDADTVLPLQIVTWEEMAYVVAAVGVTCPEYTRGGGFFMGEGHDAVFNGGARPASS